MEGEELGARALRLEPLAGGPGSWRAWRPEQDHEQEDKEDEEYEKHEDKITVQ